MKESAKINIEEWLNGPYENDTKKEIKQMMESGREAELEDAFYTDLDFGTGGMRGVMGVGTNRMNVYTVAKATQGLANYVKKQGEEAVKKGAAIAYDSRLLSKEFAHTAAEILSSNGIKVYLFSGIRPTPVLSYTVRKFGCQTGIVITASHNPKEYNGYKVYWQDGGQMVSPHDKNTIEEVRAVKTADIKKGDKSLIQIIDKEIDEPYLEAVKSLSINPQSIEENSGVGLVYSPLHGAGYSLVPASLKNYGFNNVHIVEEQGKPDGNFPTISYPNPEEREALSLGIKKAEETKAELLIATDPDCDRMGAAIRMKDGSYEVITGNQIGTLLAHYILSAKKESNTLSKNAFVVNTIVTTDIIYKIAKDFNVELESTLTGFKWIADAINRKVQSEFLFGFEESYGYLAGDFVRDKDGVIASSLLAELFVYVKSKGKTLVEYLEEIYGTYGYYHAKGVSLTKKGIDGLAEIKKMLEDYKNNPPKEINGKKVVKRIDYNESIIYNGDGIKIGEIELPKASVLQFFLEDETKITVRPSGTEPKIKFYFEVCLPSKGYLETKSMAESLIEEYVKCFVKD